MPTALNENYLEQTIADYLAQSPLFVKRTPQDFDIDAMIDRELFGQFLRQQTTAWNKLTRVYGGKSEADIIDIVIKEYNRTLNKIDGHGLHEKSVLEILNKGFSVSGAQIKFLQQKPLTTDPNDEAYRLYCANRFAVVRQFKYSKDAADKGNEIDLAILCNGVPVLTCELKNENTGQNFTDGIRQYRTERDPNNRLLQTFLVHFVIDNQLAFMTTRLNGVNTHFLPFNQGTRNEPVEGKYPTSYMWEHIFQADSLFDIICSFIKRFYDEEHHQYKVVFPRFHQLRAVRYLRRSCLDKGAGENYLIEHSAGSGKTMTMTWLAEQLANLTQNSKPVYDIIVMVTDRIVLNGNMADEVNLFITTPGLVKDIRRGSKNLADAINDGARIVVSTVQKYAYALKNLKRDKHRTFAVIVDEAHTAIGNEAAKALTMALSTDEDLKNLPDFHPEECESELDALMTYQQAMRQHMQHISYFAFTATPKDKTFVLYGKNGKEPHDLYTMKQAIEEGFILDVLKYYKSYQTLFEYKENDELNIDELDKYEKKKALAVIFENLNREQYIMIRKADLMLEHFLNHTINKIDRKAKAMIVADSRPSAVRYKLIIDDLLRKKQLDRKIKTLVAFSDTVEFNGLQYTEAKMNDENAANDNIRQLFKKDEYRILIVANKFQTGFDQPLLHTMYVDKQLAGIQTIQTLSRLNRCCPGKDDTMIIDFRNTWENIQRDFQQYYTVTTLDGEVDTQRVYQLKDDVEKENIFSQNEVDAVCQHMVDGSVEAIPSIMETVVDRAKGMLDADKLDLYRKNVKRYVRQYGFLAQVMQFTDPDLEKFDIFCSILYKFLPYTKDTLPYEILEKIDLSKLRIQKSYEGEIKLEDEAQTIESPRIGEVKSKNEDEKLTIFEILDIVNEPYMGELNEHDNIIRQVFNDLMADPSINDSFNAGNTYTVLMNIVSEKMSKKLTDEIGKYYNFLEILEQDQTLKLSLIEHFVDAIAQRTQAAHSFPYDEDKLKKRIAELLSEEFKEIGKHLRSFSDTLNTFFAVLHAPSLPSLDGINELIPVTLNKYIFDPNLRPVDKQLTYNILQSKFEAFMKKIYYLKEGVEVCNREGNSHNTQFLDAALSFDCLRGLRKNEHPAYQNIRKYFADLHDWRNAEAHTAPTLTAEQIEQRVHELLTIYLFLTANCVFELEEQGVIEL